MAETVLMQPRRKSTAGYKSAAHELLAAMNRLDEQIDRDYATAERLKLETQVIKAETQVIKVRTEATLARLQEQIDHLMGAV